MINPYIGYIPISEEKTPIRGEGLKNRTKPLHSLEEMLSMGCDYAGVLAPGYTLVDLDNAFESEKLMDIIDTMQLDCRVYRTTRGRHFIFKSNPAISKCLTHMVTACGLTADYKIGGKNCYEVLRISGKDRPLEYDVEEDFSGDYAVVPDWLRPISRRVASDDQEISPMIGMGDGDGRNDTLFKHILSCQRAKMPKDAIIETLNIINKFIFAEPMSDREMESIMRSDAFTKPQFYSVDDKGHMKFLPNVFGRWLVESAPIKRVSGALHVYKDGIYIHDTAMIRNRMLEELPELETRNRTEVLNFIEDYLIEDCEPADARYIAFKNGVYDIVEDELIPYSPDLIITNRIPHNFNPDAHCEALDSALDAWACGDPKIRAILEEIPGYCMYRRNELGISFILIGDKHNGKSTYEKIIRSMLGDENVSALSLREIGQRFNSERIFGKLANIGDDISGGFLPEEYTETFRKVSTGEWMQGEAKYERSFDFQPYCKLLFSANNIPKMQDRTGAVARRMCIVPFKGNFRPGMPGFDPYLSYKLKTEEAMEYLIQLGISGLKRVLATNAFSTNDAMKKELHEFEKSNNSVMGWMAETETSDIANHSTGDAYAKYGSWCEAAGCGKMAQMAFTKEVCRLGSFAVKQARVNGKVCRIFVQNSDCQAAG